MIRSFSAFSLLCVSVSLWFNSLTQAQLPLARLDRVFPLGGCAGSDVLIDISGRDLDDVKTLHFDHPGLTAEFVKPNQFRVKIAAETPPGTYDLRAVGTYGISGSRLFAVSRGLTEVLEKEPNDTPEKAQDVPMNAAINGHSDNNGDDFFRFLARKGERVTIDCQAFRIDSTLRASMTLSDSAGKELAQSEPYYHRTDPLLDFIAPADGSYVLRIHDATFSGGLPYRVIVSNRPQIESVFPCAAIAGETVELTVFGRNLPGGTPAPEWTIRGLPLEKLTVPFTMPKDPESANRFDFRNHLPSPSLSARGVQFFPRGLEHALNPATILLADFAVTREKEPNDSADKAQEITLPTVVSGRLDKAGDIDWYSFTAKASKPIAIELYCERLEMPGDLFVIITDDAGKELATFDDHGINYNALAQFNRDPVGAFNPPKDGKYRVLVQDRYGKGGARFQYALRMGVSEPDFYPVVFHETPNQPTCPLVGRGGSGFYEVCINRWNGLAGSVTFEAEGLPPGVTCRPVHVSPQTQFANMVFTAAPDAPEWAGTIRLKAHATVDGKRIERAVRCCQRRWPIDNINTSRICRDIGLAVRGKAPYVVKMPSGEVTVAAGGSLETKATVERLWPEFKGKLQLNGLNLPPGFGIAAVNVPEDKTEATVKITVAPNVPPGTYTLDLRGDGQVPFTRDAKTGSKPVRVANPSTPLTVVVTAAAKK
jgi:hypothetical protein